MAAINVDSSMPVTLDAIDSCANNQQKQKNPIETDDEGGKNGAEDEESNRMLEDTLAIENSELSDSKILLGDHAPINESTIEPINSLKELITDDEMSTDKLHQIEAHEASSLSPSQQQKQIVISKIDSQSIYNKGGDKGIDDVIDDTNHGDSFRNNKMYIGTNLAERKENTANIDANECNVMGHIEGANINSSPTACAIQQSSECMSAVSFQQSHNENNNYSNDLAGHNMDSSNKNELDKVSMCKSPLGNAASHWKMRLETGKCDCPAGKCECSSNISPMPEIKDNDMDDDIMSEYSNENELHSNAIINNGSSNNMEQQQQLQQQHQESHQQRHQAFQDHQQKVQQLDFQDQLQHHQQSQQSHLQQHASMQGDAEMHQFENNIYQQYNQPTNLSHGPNMHHQMPQQHQVDIQRDNDPHFQYKLYSQMYNGYENVYNDNKAMQQQQQQQQRQQQQQNMSQQTASFKPYQLDSPATPSTKHSNISSAPGTPNTIPNNNVEDGYDDDKSYFMAGHNKKQDSQSNFNPAGNLSQQSMNANRMSMMMNQQQQQQSQQKHDDPYNFVDDDETNSTYNNGNKQHSHDTSIYAQQHSMSPHQNLNNFGMALQQMRSNVGNTMSGYSPMNNPLSNSNESSMKNVLLPPLHGSMDSQSSMISEIAPKKRGRKKKVRNDEEQMMPLNITNEPGIMATKPTPPKERKKHDRFNGMSEEEVSKRTLPDHLANNLDIIIIGINPGLFAAYRGHHYAGPGNHFWKCLYLSGLTHEQMNAEEDFKLLDYGIGFTNMVQRATKGSADLTRKEIKEGSRVLHEKLRRYRPKIAVFNGKLIFEVFSGKKDFNFGRQPDYVDGTNTYMWVMPSSSARCAQLPRAADKVPFYAALKKFRDYLNGVIPHIDDSECIFADPKSKTSYENEPSKPDNLSIGRFTSNQLLGSGMTDLAQAHHQGEITDLSSTMLSGKCGNDMTDVRLMDVPGKKKRGRPKKVRGEGEENIKITVPRKQQNQSQDTELMSDGTPKKKRGRPKKVKTDNMGNNAIPTKIPANTTNIENIINDTAMDSERSIFSPSLTKCSDLSQQSQQSQQAQPQPQQCQDIQKKHQQQQQLQQQQQIVNSKPLNFNEVHNQSSPTNCKVFCGGMEGANITPPLMRERSMNMNSGNMQCSINGNFNQNMQPSPFQPLEHHNSRQHPHQHQPNTSDSPQQFSHSDLSSEISAAISTAEHLNAAANTANDTNSPSSNSQSIADFEPSECQGDSWADHSNFNVSNKNVHMQKPTSVALNAQNSPYSQSQQQQIYQQHLHQQQQVQQAHLHQHSTSNVDEMNAYIEKQTSTDVTAKSLSGLESLVDQIPSLSDNNSTATSQSTVHSISSLRENRLNDLSSMVGGVDHHQSPFQNSCLYSASQNYLSSASSSLSPMLNNPSEMRCSSNRSRNSADLNGSVTPTNLMSHYSGSNYSSTSPSVILPSTVSGLHSPSSPHTHPHLSPINNQLNSSYNPLNNHPFSVSSLTSHHSYSPTPPPSTPAAAASVPTMNSMNSYHSNFMAAAMQQPLYMEPLPSFYHTHAAYGQHPSFTSHAGYGSIQHHHNLPHVQPQSQFGTPNPPTIHMPSPTYYGHYGDHHRRQNYIASSTELFFSNHGMFDR